MIYQEAIRQLKNPTFQQLVDISYNILPATKRKSPWVGLNHGVGLLSSEEELAQYLCAYGKMHEAKIKIALQVIDEPNKIFDRSLSIIDWGCGQGLATACFFDYLNDLNIKYNKSEVVLIEPSSEALNRAKINISSYLKSCGKIKCVEKYINDLSQDDIQTSNEVIIHFFSNILDIPQVNIKQLSALINKGLSGEHYFFCVGPLNWGSTRIGEFAEALSISEEQVINSFQGKIQHTRGTIKMLVFAIKENVPHIIKTDFYPHSALLTNKNYIAMIEKIVSNLTPDCNNRLENTLQFYKAVVELEQCKEPNIEKILVGYPVASTSDQFNINIGTNKDFRKELDNNSKAKWPKDLYIGINIELDTEKYVLLNYIIPFKDLQNIDAVNCSLSDFAINLKVAETLELTEKQIEQVEEAIRNCKTFVNLHDVLRDVISGKLKLENYLYCALSQKNIALSQTYSELNKLNSRQVVSNQLLESFLCNNKFENQMGVLCNEDLIQISNIDASQQRAVLSALNNRVSVITGPPGSGKTQVILNILANAIVHNKKVLIASKNNKAVDNVKDRFNLIDELGYLVRFGSKQIYNDETLPQLNILLSKTEELKNTPLSNNAFCEFDKLRKQIKSNKAKIERRILLQKSISDIKQELGRLIQQKTDCKATYENTVSNLQNSKDYLDFSQLYSLTAIDKFNSDLKIERNKIQQQYSGISKLWFSWLRRGKWACKLLNHIEMYPIEIKEHIRKQEIKATVAKYKNGDDILEVYQLVIDMFDLIIKNITDLSTLNIRYDNDINNIDITIKTNEYRLCDEEFEINELLEQEPSLMIEIEGYQNRIIDIGRDVMLECVSNKLKAANASSHITKFKQYLPSNIPWKDLEVNKFIDDTREFLDVVGVNAVTSLSAKGTYPLSCDLFDIVVIDEASQCDIASAIPLIMRAKQLVVIGDPMQLRHISKVNDLEEVAIKQKLLLENAQFLNYNSKSLWDYSEEFIRLCADTCRLPITLDNHYRCHPDIIGYSNDIFYAKRLGCKLTVRTTEQQFCYEPKGIVWVDIKGEQFAENININKLEAEESVKLAMSISKMNPNLSIGIITPFKNQAEYIFKNIPNKLANITVDTVHKFQGDEKDIIIYSLVVTDNSPTSKINWIDNAMPNLINVAVTRARNTLYVIGNRSYIRNQSRETKPLGYLAKF